MNNRLAFLLIPLLMFPILLAAQCFDNSIPVGSSCSSALYLCGASLELHAGSITNDPLVGVQPEFICGGGGDLDNGNWIAFSACESSIEYLITPSNCGVTGNGLQVGIYEDCTFQKTIFCYKDDSTPQPITVTVDDLVPGNLYYMVLDGYAGSTCDYIIDVISGIDITPADASGPVAVDLVAEPDTVCTDESMLVSITIPDLSSGGVSCGELSQEDLEYVACFDWMVTGTPDDVAIDIDDAYTLVDDDSGADAEIVFSAAGDYTVSVIPELNPAVFSLPGVCAVADLVVNSVDVTVLPMSTEVLPVIRLCEGQTSEFCGIIYSSDDIATCVDPDNKCKTFIQQFEFEPMTTEMLGGIFICADECFEIDDTQYCDDGTYDHMPTTGCEIQRFTLIDIEGSLNYSGNTVLSCANPTLTLDVDIIGSNVPGPFSYSWQDADENEISTDATLSVNSSGFYTVLVTSDQILDGCEYVYNIEITENGDLPILNFDPPTISCSDEMGQIITLSNVALTSILWSGPNAFASDQLSPMVSDTGMYTVAVIGNNGCPATFDVHVMGDLDRPVVVPIYNDIDCNDIVSNLSYNASIPIVSQQWSSIGFNNDEVTTTTNFSGDYTLVVTASNGCTGDANFTVNDLAIQPQITLGADMLWYCNTEELMVTATVPSNSSYSYDWSVLAGDPLSPISDVEVQLNSIGLYQVMATDPTNGCTTRDTIEVTSNADVPTGIVGQILDPDCFGFDNGSILIESITGGQGPYTLSLGERPLEMSVPLNNVNPGIYILSIIDANECEYGQQIDIVEPIEIILDAADSIEVKYYSGGVATLEYNIDPSDITSILWYDPQGNVVGEGEEIEIQEERNTQYTVELTTLNGCSETRSIEIIVDATVDIYAPNIFSPNADGRNDLFWVQGEDPNITITNMAIFDRWGNKVYTQDDMALGEDSVGWDGTYKGTPLNPGVYIYVIRIKTGDQELIKTGDITLVR